MQDFWQWLFEGQQAYIASDVMKAYEQGFLDELNRLLQRTRHPELRAKFEEMLTCPIVDSRGQCRSFTDYIVSALIRNGIHHRYDLEQALHYIAEKLLMPTSETGEPRVTVFAGFEERPDYVKGNPLQARFMRFLQFAINNIRKGKIPRLATFGGQRPTGTVSIGQRQKDAPAGELSPDEIPARQSTDLDELLWDIKLLLQNKERAYGLPLVAMFQGMMQGERVEQQRSIYGEKTASMARKAIIDTVKDYAEKSGNYALMNLLGRFQEPRQPVPRAPKVVQPKLPDRDRDYASIVDVVARFERPVGSADLGRYRRRWLDYPPRNPASGHRNRLEEVLSSMTADGVLQATRGPAGAIVYSAGPRFNDYRRANLLSLAATGSAS